jgi:hypothetical protein
VAPLAVAFADFVARAAERYDGAPGSPGRVALWSLVNEPNSRNQLMPQHRRGRPFSPHVYRRLVRAGLAALAGAGVRPQDVLLGEQLGVARQGTDERAPVPPRTFLRELLCLDRRDRPVRSAAGHPGCGRPAPLDAGGWSVHPYFPPAGPTVPTARPDTLYPSTVGRLLPTLDAARRAGRLTRRWDLWDTEDGVQTDPPDRYFGARPALQAAHINEAEHLLWRARRVRSAAQYLWRDEPLRSGSFQSGLRYADGRAKPSLAAYRLPVAVRSLGRKRVALWARLPPGCDAAVLRGPGAARRPLPGPSSDRTVVLPLRVPASGGAVRVVCASASSRRLHLPAGGATPSAAR